MMLGKIRRFLDSQVEFIKTGNEDNRERGFQFATAALLIEMTRADFEVQQEELDAVAEAIRSAFDLTQAESEELVALAEVEMDHATSLHEFTATLNAELGAEQRRHVIELLWRVAYADGRLDKYEDHFVRKIADLLYVRHSEFMKAKHRVLEELGLDSK